MFDITDEACDGLEARELGEPPPGRHIPFGQPEPPPAPGPVVPFRPEMPSPVGPPPGDTALRRGAARGFLMATGGLIAGTLFLGPIGGAAGVVAVGVARNTLRAKDGWADPDPAVRNEAGKSATMAIFGIGIAGMLGYYAWQRRYGDDS